MYACMHGRPSERVKDRDDTCHGGKATLMIKGGYEALRHVTVETLWSQGSRTMTPNHMVTILWNIFEARST